MTESLGELESVDVRRLWPHEAADFTPWLASEENISKLADALGLELEAEGTEVAVGPYSADILARDSAGNYVVIENQLAKTNHDHLGKSIQPGRVALQMCSRGANRGHAPVPVLPCATASVPISGCIQPPPGDIAPRAGALT